ncbi:MAG: alpha/beta hydrolase-fold protein [Phycisphaerales bacterium]
MRIRTLVCLLILSLAPIARADTVRVLIADGLVDAPVTGRLVLFFITEQGERWERTDPLNGPFFSEPQPIASALVEDLRTGVPFDIDTTFMTTFPLDFRAIGGRARIRAVLDRDNTSPSLTDAPGNLVSDVVEMDLTPDEPDLIEVRLTGVTEPRPMPEDSESLKWVTFRSEMLSAHYGRDVFHRAGVALPASAAEAYGVGTREVFPAVYVIPGFGGDHRGAMRYARMLEADPETPNAVYIVLDPASPYGHHGFMDSPNHGPRARALVKEFIPELERRFHLAPSPEARIVTGHSSGGWSSLWLGLTEADTFGACWSSAPDPVDFHAFQLTNIYADASMYAHDGRDTPSYRQFDDDGGETVAMTVRQEGLMERAVSPDGDSGQQWDTWEAMFGPRDEETGLPAPMFDARTGRIDHAVVEHWKRFDITRMVTEDWAAYGPVLTSNIRLVCGTNDSFYLNRAVELLKQKTDPLRAQMDGPGYIRLVEGATHGTIIRAVASDWNREMREYLAAQGFAQ